MPGASFRHEYTRVDVGPLDKLFYKGNHRRATEWEQNGIYAVLEDNPEASEYIPYRDLYHALHSGAAKIEYDYYSKGVTKLRQRYGKLLFTDCNPDQIRNARRMRYFIARLEECMKWRHGKRPSDSDLEDYLPQWNDDYNEILKKGDEADEDGVPRSRHHTHAKKVDEFTKAPCVKTLKNNYQNFIECDRNIIALVRKPAAHSKRAKVFTPQSLALAKEFAFKYASPKKPKEIHLLRDLNLEVRRRNELGKNTGIAERYEEFGRKAFHKLIGLMEEWWVCAKRKGFKAAVKAYRAQLTGMQVWRPGQQVEFDDYMMHAHTWFRLLNIWDLLPEPVKQRLETRRAWITIGIDAATRYVVAVVPSRNTNADAVISALNMALSDKTDIARRAGAKMPWLGGVRFECAMADNGKPYVANKTEDAFRNCKIAYLHPPKGQPWHRSFVESLLTRFGGDILSYIDGQTFANPVIKGEYSAELHANLLVEELMALIIRWIVDVYHQEPVVATGETPHNAWARYIQENRVRFAPTEDERREYFGIDFSAVIHPEGVFHNGIRYNSLALNRHRQVIGDEKARFRIHYDNIEWISAHINGEWIPVRNKAGINQRTSMLEWCEIRKRWRTAKKAKADENWQIIAEARRDIREATDSAANRAKFTPDGERPDSVRKLIRQLGDGHGYESQLIEAALKYALTDAERAEFDDYVPSTPVVSSSDTAVTPVRVMPVGTTPIVVGTSTQPKPQESSQSSSVPVAFIDDEEGDDDGSTGNW